MLNLILSNWGETMGKTKVFIDGREGTTGLRIHDRLRAMEDIELIVLEEHERKNIEKRKRALNNCDIAFLCLPDEAAAEAAKLIENDKVVLIDTSTAHRTEPGWTYGLPELGSSQAKEIIKSNRIAVPGCHASGFIALIYPLVEKNLISDNIRLTCFSITGYSGGGRKMISEYQDSERADTYNAPRQYGISQKHKHLREMTFFTKLNFKPVFCPIVADFYSGMEVTVPLFKEDLFNGFTIDDIKETYRKKYSGKIIKYIENDDLNGFLPANYMSGYDNMIISVHGNEDRILLTARYDNLGKGASGAAIECMNYKLGKENTFGLIIKE